MPKNKGKTFSSVISYWFYWVNKYKMKEICSFPTNSHLYKLCTTVSCIHILHLSIGIILYLLTKGVKKKQRFMSEIIKKKIFRRLSNQVAS